MAAHVYWRVYISATLVVGNNICIAEIQLYSATGTLLSTGGTATASSFYTSDPNYNADKAFDNNDGTFWSSNAAVSTTPQWIQYQMPSAGDVALMRLTPRKDGFITSQSPKDFKLQYSDDGSSWTDALTVTGMTWSGLWYTTSFPVTTPGAGQYANYRAFILSTQSGTPPSCAELELHETVGGADLTSSTLWHCMRSDVFSVQEAYMAFDNVTGTFWAANNNPPNNWIANAISRCVAVVELVWVARNDSFYVQCPSNFKLQGSNDGMTWTDVATITPATWTSPGQSQTLAVGAAGGTGVLRHPGMDGMRPLMTGGMNG